MFHRVLIALALAAAAIGSGLVFAASADPGFTLSVSPTSQTMRQGESGTYWVTVTRKAGFSEKVALSVTGLPSGTTGTVGGVSSTPGTPAGAQPLLVDTSEQTPPGTYAFKIVGTSAKKKVVTLDATLVVLAAQAAYPDFALSIAPASRSIVQSDDASYSVTVSRSGGFTGPVSLEPASLPAGITGSVSPSTITGSETPVFTVSTAPRMNAGSYEVWIRGRATIDGASVVRSAAATIVVSENREFMISGELPAALAPGISVPLDLSITNPHNFPIAIRSLAATVQEKTDAPGCSGTANFVASEMDAGSVVVPAKASRKLSQVGVALSQMPQVGMRNLPTNQDACKSARIHLQYAGTAAKP